MGFGIMVNSLEPLQEALDKFPKRDTKTQGEYLAFIEIWLRDCNNKFFAFQRNLKERALEIDNPSNDYGEVCKQNRQYRSLLKELLSGSEETK